MAVEWLLAAGAAARLVVRLSGHVDAADEVGDLGDATAPLLERLSSRQAQSRLARSVRRQVTATLNSAELSATVGQRSAADFEVGVVLDKLQTSRDLVNLTADPPAFCRRVQSVARPAAHARLADEAAIAVFDVLLDATLAQVARVAEVSNWFQPSALVRLLEQGRLLQDTVEDVKVDTTAIREGQQKILDQLQTSGPASAGAAPVWPITVGRPPGLAGAYQPRAEVRDALRQAWAGATTVVIEQDPSTSRVSRGKPSQLLTGDGGIGKSQLAAGVYADAEETVDLRVWVPASTLAQLLQGYAAAAAAVRSPRYLDPEVMVAAEGFLGWLSDPANRCSWLVVLDDVAEPAHVMAPWWPPATASGRVLVTTRRQDGGYDGHGRARLPMTVFTPVEAMNYLRDRLDPHLDVNIPADSLTDAAGLTEDLGYLPVALTQAAAVIIDHGWTVTEYRSAFADVTATVADLFPEDAPADGYGRTVASTWTLAMAAATGHSAHAPAMAALLAWTDPNGSPRNLFTTPTARAYLADAFSPAARQGEEPAAEFTGEGSPKLDVSDGQATAALRALNRLSIVTVAPDLGPTDVRIHALAQRAIRDTLTPVGAQRAARAVAGALLEVWPPVENAPALSAALRANTTHLVDLAKHTRWLWTPDAHPVLFQAGNSYGQTGSVAQARDYYAELLPDMVRILGPDHPDTLTTRALLAHWRGQAGDPAGAATAFADLLTDSLRVLGPDHPNTLTTRADLAYWRGQAGDPAAF